MASVNLSIDSALLSSFEIPARPSALVGLMGELRSTTPDLRRIASIAESDLGVSAALLKLANSPAFRTGRAVHAVREAIDRLGVKSVSSVVLGRALRDSLSGLDQGFVDTFWSRTSDLAIAVTALARKAFKVPTDLAYVYAMYHDVGIPLLMRRFPGYASVMDDCERDGGTRRTCEDLNLSTNHAVVGALLARNWGLAPEVVDAIRAHHDPDTYGGSSSVAALSAQLIAVTHLAEQMLSELWGEKCLEVESALLRQARDYFGLVDADIDELREILSEAGV